MHSNATIPPPMTVREPRPGDVLGGRYHIEAELGRGGFGVVFRARHLEVEREVAIKVLLATYAAADSTAVARFRREAQIASSLHYPNAVQVYDYGETDEGVFYIVMEFLKGKALSEVISRGGAIAPRRATHIIRQVLHALMEAHARGFVHRDIKPDNVMLTPLAFDHDFVKVMDFGIAKMVSSEGSSLTQAGLTLGTPRYMPEEQLRGRQSTPATDLYAVGIVLYEMLTGRRAIEAGSLVEVAAQILQGAEVQLPMGGPVPDALARVVNTACSRAPQDRYQRAQDFLAALNDAEREASTDGADTDQDPPRTQIIDARRGSGDGAATLVLANQGKTVMLHADDVHKALADATSVVGTPDATSLVTPPAGAGSPSRTERQTLNLVRLSVGLSGAALSVLILMALGVL